MKKYFFAVLFSLVLLTALYAQSGPPIVIVNHTGYEVWYVYISPSESELWGEDRLADDQILANGEAVTLNLPQPLNVTNYYDIMIVDQDGDSYTKWDVLVAANSGIVFTFEDIDW
ncbi:MAG: hypothetical protein FWH19_02760 [Treponema sp.]|nr:hypothetical protein [Treponema sp.]